MKRDMMRTAPRLTVKAAIMAILGALVAAVALPQICHVAGRALGLGAGIGEALLPMHLPILLVGLLAGPAVGGIAGVLAPLLSYLLSSMPSVSILPFMCVELFAYGLLAGALCRVRMPALLKLLAAQLGGRSARLLALLIARSMDKTALPLASVWNATVTGAWGLALQWVLIPLILMLVKRHER